MACGKGKLKGLELQKRRKSKNSKCVGMWFNAIGSIFKFRHAPCLHDYVTGHVICRHSFSLELVREKDSIILFTYSLTGRNALLLSLLPYLTLLFLFASLPFLLTLLSSSLLLGYNYSKFFFLFLPTKNSGLEKLFLLASSFNILAAGL